MTTPKYGLECNEHWADLMLRGVKTLELRSYPLPADALGQPVLLLASNGRPGAPALGDVVARGSSDARVVGTVVFAGEQVLASQEAFEAAAARHRVPPSSGFGWAGVPLHAWLVQGATALATPEPPPAMTRLHRSLYSVDG